MLDTLSKDGDEFSGAIDRLEQLIKGLSSDRDPIGTAIESLDNGTASLADLLGRARPPLDGTIDQLNRLAPMLDNDKDRLDATIQRLPEIYRKLARVGSYGAFFPYYICGNQLPRQRSSGPHRGLPLDQARAGKVRGGLDAEIPRIPTRQGGFIGVVLIILVIAVGLQPERLIHGPRRCVIRRCSPRPAASSTATT